MGYAEHNLISEEVITYRGLLHWIVLVRSVTAGLLMDLAAIFAIVLSVSHRVPEAFVLIGVVLLLISGLVIASSVMLRNSAEFVVTNKRVIVKLGILHKRTAEMFLQKIESIGVDQPMAGRLLNFGTISINGTGGTIEAFPTIASPFEFRRQVQEQIGAASGRAFAAMN